MDKWEIYRNIKGMWKHIDTVFYVKGMSAEEVKRSLINHDGYPSDIVLKWA